MTEFEWLVVILSFCGVLLLPALGLLVHLVSRSTAMDARMNELSQDIREIIDAKEKVHSEMYRQMREDRAATDKRLRWLEENIWNRARVR